MQKGNKLLKKEDCRSRADQEILEEQEVSDVVGDPSRLTGLPAGLCGCR